MKENWIKKWEKIRFKGRRQFIIRRSIMWAFYGFFYTVLESSYREDKDDNSFILSLLLHLLIFLIGGCIVDLFIWRFNEEKYIKMEK